MRLIEGNMLTNIFSDYSYLLLDIVVIFFLEIRSMLLEVLYHSDASIL